MTGLFRSSGKLGELLLAAGRILVYCRSPEGLWEYKERIVRLPKTRASWVGILSGLMLALPVLTACSSEPSSLPPVANQASDLPVAEATLPPTPDLALTPDTPTPEPTVLPTPKPEVTPVPASAHREELQEAAFGYLRELAEGLGPRESATAEEKAAADFLMTTFTELGYSPSLQEFEETSWRRR